jgi:TolA-binding protein
VANALLEGAPMFWGTLASPDLDIRIELGNTAVRSGRYDEAIGEYQKVLGTLDKESKKRGDILVRIGETQRRKGDYSAAVATLQQARAILPR